MYRGIYLSTKAGKICLAFTDRIFACLTCIALYISVHAASIVMLAVGYVQACTAESESSQLSLLSHPV